MFDYQCVLCTVIYGIFFLSYIYRTEMTHCLSDTEFLAKLHCLRLAMEVRTYSVTCLNQTSLGPTFVLKIVRCSVYTG